MGLSLSIPFLVLAIALALQLPGYSYNTRLFPLLIVIPLIIMSAIQVAKDVIGLVKERKAASAASQIDSPGADTDVSCKLRVFLKKLISINEPAGAFVWIFLVIMFGYVFSILTAAFVFIFLYLRLIAKSTWFKSFLAAAITSFSVYFVFGYLLSVNFFNRALFFIWLAR